MKQDEIQLKKWLPQLPQEWMQIRGKWLFKKQDRPVNIDDEVVTCFRDGEVTLRKNRRIDGFTNAIQEHGYQGIRKGDLVIHQMDAFAGAIGISDSNGKSTPVYIVLTPSSSQKASTFYYCYLMRNLAKTGFILSLAKGIRERSTDFRHKDFSALLLPVPPLPEQTRIANYLDDKCAKIDKAIAQKERLIELLEERKQIIIQNAVTKGLPREERIKAGLPPDVKMKDSGIDWIGEIPEGWEVKKLKYLVDINSRVIDKTQNNNQRIKYVDIGSVSFENGIEKFEQYTLENAPSRAQRLARVGDSIVSTVRTYLKAIAFVDTLSKSEFIYSTGFAILSPKTIASTYLNTVIKSDLFTEQVKLKSKGMSYPAINSSDLSNILLLTPNSEAQKLISKFVKCEINKINKASNFSERSIVKLKEYKATLIDSLVTGKVRVMENGILDKSFAESQNS